MVAMGRQEEESRRLVSLPLNQAGQAWEEEEANHE